MALCNAYQRGFSARVPFPSASVGAVHLQFMNMNRKPWKSRLFCSIFVSINLDFVSGDTHGRRRLRPASHRLVRDEACCADAPVRAAQKP